MASSKERDESVSTIPIISLYLLYFANAQRNNSLALG